ncbi:MAG: hypothetical protein FJX72_05005 [Armatimonadetes bacterium]|nr:hypothetical protein [Armatimonadota bacterium]
MTPTDAAPSDHRPPDTPRTASVEARELIRGVEERGSLTPEECEALCALASDPSVLRWRIRGEACRALRFAAGRSGLEERACAALSATLASAATIRKDLGIQWIRRDLPITASVIIALAVFADMRGVIWDMWMLVAVGALAFWPAVLVLVTIFESVTQTHLEWVRLQALESVCVLGRPEAAGAVLRACVAGGLRLRAAARRRAGAIVRAIPADGYGRYGSCVLDLTTLARESAGSLGDACIEALERVGDGRAVEPLERLGARLRSGGATSDTPVVQAIERALIVLRERRRVGMARAHLVRPAQRPADDANVLLRPVTASPSEDAGLLVRPASAPEAGADGEDLVGRNQS